MPAERFSGLLLASGSDVPEPDWSEFRLPEAPTPLPPTRWLRSQVVTPEPIMPQDAWRGPGPYAHPILYRVSGRRLLLLGHHRAVVQHIRDVLLPHFRLPALSPVEIKVDRLVKDLASSPGSYALTFVHARVSVLSPALNFLSFYGEDVAEARIFREHLDLCDCHTCGLRDVGRPSELVRLGNNGSIAFSYVGGIARLREIERVLTFMRQRGYLGPDSQG